MNEIMEYYLADDPRKSKVRLRDELNHCARQLGLWKGRNYDYDSKDAIKIVSEFKKIYPPRGD